MKSSEISEALNRIENLLKEQQPRPMTVVEAASYLAISKSRLYGLTSRSVIAHYKPNGKRLYFLKRDLDAYLLRNRVTSIEEVEQDVLHR